MIVKRIKVFSSILPPKFNPIGSIKYPTVGKANTVPGQAIRVEQMRTQRQLMQTQRMKQSIQSQKELARQKQIAQLQKMEQKKDIESNKQLVREKNSRQELNPATRNWGMVKTTSKIVPPVSMKS